MDYDAQRNVDSINKLQEGSVEVDTAQAAGASTGKTAGARGGFLSTVTGKVVAAISAVAVVATAVTVAVVVNKKDEPAETTVETTVESTETERTYEETTTETTVTTTATTETTTSSLPTAVTPVSVDVAVYGNYEGKPIEWLVLDSNDYAYLLLSKDVIDVQRFDDNGTNYVWGRGSIRNWLNSDFANAAFTKEQRTNEIYCEMCVTPDDPVNGMGGDIYSEETVFLLSVADVNKYFPDESSRIAGATSHAIEMDRGRQGVYLSWWLRDTSENGCPTCVTGAGSICGTGGDVMDAGCGVRPAMWVYKNAVKITSGGADKPSTGTVTYGDLVPDSKGIVRFGTYYNRDIEWMVLDETEDSMLLITKTAIEAKMYNEEPDKGTVWEECTLRQWLNGDFFSSAFSSSEQNRINLTHLENADNPSKGTEAGNDTDDHVFLLSVDEAKKYFDSDEARKTTLVIDGKMKISVNYGAYCQWYLRTPGSFNDMAAIVDYNGVVSERGISAWINNNTIGVRPAIWVKK